MKINSRKSSRSVSRRMLNPLKCEHKLRITSKLPEPRRSQSIGYLPLNEAVPICLRKTEVFSLAPNPLLIHEVSSNSRAKMVDWMLEVTSTFRCDAETFFIAVKLMDKFFKAHSSVVRLCDLHCLGVTCMFISSKMQDVKPLVLDIVVRKIAHNQLTKREIRDMEQKVLCALDFKINLVTTVDYLINIQVNVPTVSLEQTLDLCRLCQYFVDYSEVRPSMIVHACLTIATSLRGDFKSKEFMFKQGAAELAKNIQRNATHFKYLFPQLKNFDRFCKSKVLENLCK